MIAQYTCESHIMNHTYHMCIRIRTCMVNQLKVGLDWHIWLDWLWSILWAKFVMKINEKKKKKKGARIFPFSNVFVFKRLNACTNMNIMFYGVVTYWPIIKGCPFVMLATTSNALFGQFKQKNYFHMYPHDGNMREASIWYGATNNEAQLDILILYDNPISCFHSKRYSMHILKYLNTIKI